MKISFTVYYILNKVFTFPLVMARAHGGLSSAGKVRKATPKVEKQQKTRIVRGRANLNRKYKKFFLSKSLM